MRRGLIGLLITSIIASVAGCSYLNRNELVSFPGYNTKYRASDRDLFAGIASLESGRLKCFKRDLPQGSKWYPFGFGGSTEATDEEVFWAATLADKHGNNDRDATEQEAKDYLEEFYRVKCE